MIDRYTKFILTVIAGALLYLGVIFTPLPGASAQTPSLRPGDSSGPTQVVVVGWRAPAGDTVPVEFQRPVPVTLRDTVTVTGKVQTERSSNRADRVVLVGWEQRGSVERLGNFESLNDERYGPSSGLPVKLPK